MKYVSIYLRDKTRVTVTAEQAEAILNSQQQLIKINEKGKWNGLAINKADIVRMDRDYDKERDERQEAKGIEAPKLTKEEKKRIEQKRKEIGEEIRNKFTTNR